jgi:hypothetical protein
MVRTATRAGGPHIALSRRTTTRRALWATSSKHTQEPAHRMAPQAHISDPPACRLPSPAVMEAFLGHSRADMRQPRRRHGRHRRCRCPPPLPTRRHGRPPASGPHAAVLWGQARRRRRRRPLWCDPLCPVFSSSSSSLSPSLYSPPPCVGARSRRSGRVCVCVWCVGSGTDDPTGGPFGRRQAAGASLCIVLGGPAAAVRACTHSSFFLFLPFSTPRAPPEVRRQHLITSSRLASVAAVPTCTRAWCRL